MPVESAADRAQFVNANDFGIVASYTPVGGPAVSVTGIFNRPHLSIAMGDAATSDAQPTFYCRGADLPADASGGGRDLMLIAGETFQVVSLQPDGTGMTLLALGLNQ